MNLQWNADVRLTDEQIRKIIAEAVTRESGTVCNPEDVTLSGSQSYDFFDRPTGGYTVSATVRVRASGVPK